MAEDGKMAGNASDKKKWFDKLKSGYQKGKSAEEVLKGGGGNENSTANLIYNIIKYWKVALVIFIIAILAGIMAMIGAIASSGEE